MFYKCKCTILSCVFVFFLSLSFVFIFKLVKITIAGVFVDTKCGNSDDELNHGAYLIIILLISLCVFLFIDTQTFIFNLLL